eukprot:1465694-Rhodomonas_salina.3
MLPGSLEVRHPCILQHPIGAAIHGRVSSTETRLGQFEGIPRHEMAARRHGKARDRRATAAVRQAGRRAI